MVTHPHLFYDIRVGMLNTMLARRTSEVQMPNPRRAAQVFCFQHAYCYALMHLFQTHVFVTQLNAIEI